MADLHQFHRAIGYCLKGKLPSGCILIKDQACGGEQRIALFRSLEKSRENEFCQVDMLIHQNQKIRAIIEIEESDIKPHQVCGKLLTSALSSHYIPASPTDEPIVMGEQVIFIEILEISKLKDKSKKRKQFENLEQSISKVLPLKHSTITEYHLISGKFDEIARIQAELVGFLQTNL